MNNGAISFTGEVKGHASYAPGGGEKASAATSPSNTTAASAARSPTSKITAVSDKIKLDNGLIDLKSGDLSGHVSLNLPGILTGDLNPHVNVKTAKFEIEGDVTFGFAPLTGKKIHLKADNTKVELSLASDIDASVGPLGMIVKAGETKLTLAQGSGLSGDIGGTVKIPNDDPYVDGTFKLHASAGDVSGSANVAIKSIGPFEAVPSFQAEWHKGRGITVHETNLTLKSEYTAHIDPKVKFSVTDNKLDVTGTVKAKNMGILSEGAAQCTVHYATGAGVTIDGSWHLPGNLSILQSPSVTFHYDKATGVKITASTSFVSPGGGVTIARRAPAPTSSMRAGPRRAASRSTAISRSTSPTSPRSTSPSTAAPAAARPRSSTCTATWSPPGCTSPA